MLGSTKLALAVSAARTLLREATQAVNAADEPTAELMTGMNAAETALTETEKRHGDLLKSEAALERTAGDEFRNAGDPGERNEIRSLRGRVSIARYLSSAANDRALTGAESEFNAALALPEDRNFPLEILAGPEETEVRTMTDSVNTQRSRRWIDRLFGETAAQFVGVTFDSVDSGEQVYTTTKTGGTPAQRGREQAAAVAAWTLGTTSLSPTRMSLFYEYSREDAIRLPGLETALRRDMRGALADRVDFAIFKGDSGANENRADIAGLNSVADVVAITISQANKVKAAQTLAALAGLVDGKHAASMGDLRPVVSVPYSTLLSSTLPISNSSETLAAILRGNGLSFRARPDIDDGTGNGKLLAIIGRAGGQAGAAVAAVWSGAELVRDPYSGASAGKVGISLHSYWDFAVPRPSNFAKLGAVT